MAQHILAENAHAAFAREQQTQEDRQRRRLAGAVAAEQRRGRAALDGKADAADRERRAIAFYEIVDGDDGRTHRRYMPSFPIRGQHRVRPMGRGSSR